MENRVELKWSKREKDWIFNYPDLKGSTLTGIFFDMVKTTGHRTDWDEDLKTLLTNRGYDYTTLKITCKKIKK